MRKCAVAGCKEETYWMRPRQSAHGYCIDHAIATPVAATDAFMVLLDEFDGAEVAAAPTPRYAPDSYGQERDVKVIDSSLWLISGKPHWSTTLVPPLDAGPCEGCRRTIRRYGPEGYPYCTECEPIS